MRRSGLVALALLIIATVVLSACASPTGGQMNGQMSEDSTANHMAPASALPTKMQQASARVRSAYQFAVANPDALKNVPCYCGCQAVGHTSNLSCYIKDRKADGQAEFDEHALGCSLCVDISQDVMKMTGEGKSPQDIRASIVSAYSKYGPGNQ